MREAGPPPYAPQSPPPVSFSFFVIHALSVAHSMFICWEEQEHNKQSFFMEQIWLFL